MRIVETDNFCGDYPDEVFLNIPSVFDKGLAQQIADSINAAFSTLDPGYPRFWLVVEDDYKLQPGFEP